eukprot:PhF_6_TR7001/c0_g1_i3/m.10397
MSDDIAILNMTWEERELRWGFTYNDLQTTMKVVTILQDKPSLFLGDPWLRNSKLFDKIVKKKLSMNEIGSSKVNCPKRVHRELQRAELQDRKWKDKVLYETTGMKVMRDTIADNLRKAQFGIECSSTSSSAATTCAVEEGHEEQEDRTVHKARRCYVCKQKYDVLHHYYYSMCPPCSSLNWSKRFQRRNLSGQPVLLTGCRIKIGFEIMLSLLRQGAFVIGTTRFPLECERRLQTVSDYNNWSHKVKLYNVDLRNLHLVTAFSQFIADNYPYLFAIIHNAAQTIARPPSYHEQHRKLEQSFGHTATL